MDWLKGLFPLKDRKIFLDYASATPVRSSVRKAMEKYWSNDFYNPSAIYEEGLKVKSDVEDFRARVAKIVGAGQKDIIFTASGTESDNLAILGAFEAYKESLPAGRKKPHVIISAIEHPAVMRAAEEMVRRGGEMSIMPVNDEGVVVPERIKLALKPNTFLVSVGYANSEIGVVQNISKIGRIIKEYRKERDSEYPLLHTDASASPCFLPVGLEKLQCDLLTLDGSKIYGPKGVGLLAVRRGVKLRPIVHGGGQERGLRGGTLSPALIAGFTRALETAEAEREKESKRIEKIRNGFIEAIHIKLPNAIINGPAAERSQSYLPNIVSISIPGIMGEFLALKLERTGLLVSVGTACSLDERESGSPVIRALGRADLAESTIRISFGIPTTENEAKKAGEIFCREVQNMLK